MELGEYRIREGEEGGGFRDGGRAHLVSHLLPGGRVHELEVPVPRQCLNTRPEFRRVDMRVIAGDDMGQVISVTKACHVDFGACRERSNSKA